MGVSGAGKTTVGRALADRLSWSFFDADDYHPPENIEKMAGGQALDDEDRKPWLQVLAETVRDRLDSNQPAVLACSALRETYRSQLMVDDQQVQLVCLDAEPELISGRLAARDKHFMPPELLQSQMDTLELPEDALMIDASESVDDIVSWILDELQ